MMAHQGNQPRSLPGEAATAETDCSSSRRPAIPVPKVVPFALPDYRKFEFRASGSGLGYEIFLYVPDTEPPPSGFPVIYVLDANSDFITVAETVKRTSRRSGATGISASIVVGVGYPDTEAYNLDRRQFDFTRKAADENALPDPSNGGCGGQGAFVAFLRDQLQPWIEQNHPANPTRRTLLGHSLAGYFVLDLLTRQPGAFAGYVSLSPSIWWDRPGLSHAVSEMGRNVPQSMRIYMAVGEREQDAASTKVSVEEADRYQNVRRVRRMIDNARELAGEIDAALGDHAAIKFEIGADEDHSTIVLAMLCRALRFIDSI